jgi:DNA-binding transcriptional LysR family regulator
VNFKRGQLLSFVTVAEEGQITRAANKLHIAQPALSQSIAQLEEEVGLKLLERHARGVTLTAAGEAFLERARLVVATERDAEAQARSLARADKGILEIGFVGPPPRMHTPELFDAFIESHPGVEVSFRDLPFPRGATLAWLDEVDIAFCHAPRIEEGVRVQPVRSEPRAVLAHKSHPLAKRPELAFAEVLNETFISYHPEVQEDWAGFHNLDDHRGGPPRAMTIDRASTSMQMLGGLGMRGAITTVPLCDAKLAEYVLPDVVAIPLCDADPLVLSLVWAASNSHPVVEALAAAANGRDANPPDVG